MRTGARFSLVATIAVLAQVSAGSTRVFAQGACCMTAGCEPAADAGECTVLGGVFLPGADCADDPCALGACCSDNSCAQADAVACISAGRDFIGAGTICLDDPCAIGVGACCDNGQCSEISLEDCDVIGGTWLGGGSHCFNGPCDLGGCCSPGVCIELARFECAETDGDFDEGADCTLEACEVPFGCPLDSLYSQTRDGPVAFLAMTSEASAGLQRWDNYSGVTGAVEEVIWWGLDLEFSAGDFFECTESNNVFEITFHADNGGFPGEATCSYTLTASPTPTGVEYFESELNEYRVTLPEPCVLVNGWISIVGLGDADCWFLWMSSSIGDDRSICDNCQSSEQDSDLSFCLVGSAGGVFGACCDLSTGLCGNGVEIGDCAAAGQRFEPDTICDDLDPSCAQTNGACCFDDGDCFADLPTDCSSAGGNWLGASTSCELCPAVGACCLTFETCLQLTEVECLSEAANWLGADTTCEQCPDPPSCPADSLFSQLPDAQDDFLAGTSETSSPFRRWEDFSEVGGAVESVRWWGFDLENTPGTNDFVECVEADNTFEISFHSDAGGVPGPAVCSYTLAATRTPTGQLYFGAELNEYEVVLSEPCVLVAGWISIVGVGDPTCWFLWLSAGIGESYCEGCGSPDESYDLSVCLAGTLGGVFGACCDDTTSSCDNDVEISECTQPGLRFTADLSCEQLDPQCGIIIGACCVGDGSCSIESAESCASAGGNWLGANTICSSCPCVILCPAGSTVEGEPVCFDNYVDTFNGGCDAETVAFSPISMCESICGQGGAFVQDLSIVPEFDWYEISVDSATELTWTVEAEFPIVTAIVDGTLGCAAGSVIAQDVAGECESLSISTPVAAGIYWLVVVASQPNDLAACGGHYTATVTDSSGTCDCPADFDGDGQVRVSDLIILLGAWGPNPGHPADLNGDGEVRVPDLIILLGVWGQCA